MEEQKSKKQGHKKKGQKYKSLLVWNLLLKRTDENHAEHEPRLAAHLTGPSPRLVLFFAYKLGYYCALQQ